MKNKLEVYKSWAPDNVLWTEWVKPVVFANLVPYADQKMIASEIDWTFSLDTNTMIIVDLPSAKGVEEGLGLAKIGYRPIPLYNGVKCSDGLPMVVDVKPIERALYYGASLLDELNIASDAPPVFLLDSSRMPSPKKQVGTYDNRWCIFPQDMPSADYLISRGISKIIIRADKTQNDLVYILRLYQKKGIKIYTSDGDVLKLSTPSKLKNLHYRFKLTIGLTRNAAGGFGGAIPEPLEGGGRYYGIG